MRRESLAVVTFKWRPPPIYRSQFSAEHVNVLQRMVARHLKRKHRFVCITDDARGVQCETVPLWREPFVPGVALDRPNCYRRLRLWARDAAEIVGAKRILALDLDTVVVADLAPLIDRDEDLVIWGDTARGTPYNGSMWLLRAGSRPQVWEQFDPLRSPARGRQLGYIGSDQAWLGACLGKGEAKYSAHDGVYSFRNEILPPRGTGRLPGNARIVFFHGKHDPWDAEVQDRYPWVREHWR